ncbi:polysaccharide pyruvyl transferase family protein [Klebsiella pneumoniae]|uniref:polysaccharide pyruvyl transferase family protein n=1 Tax=Klebsiella pneumoniae TaxID=573 RepID=UPI0027D2DFDE|nr:polysaccharide pyruvyl transferase family protein [Klebsiella pneumoniae]
MKVAILTQPLHTNFGGTLQAFALQKILQRLGCQPTTINFRWKSENRSFWRNILYVVKNKIMRGNGTIPFTKRELIRIGINHRKFIEKNINLSPSFYYREEVSKYFSQNDFSAVIVGSDQVWRPRYSPGIGTFFLDFLSEQHLIKLSYAASFGTDDWEFSDTQTIFFSNLLSKFTSVSVRESSAVNLCKKHLSIDAKHVLDPTMLLSKCDYIKLFSLKPSNSTSGVFNYVLDSTDEKSKIISYICDELNSSSFSNTPIETIKKTFFIKDIDNFTYPAIESWVQSFNNANFIVTDSFHGTVFSIIFNKPFFAIANEARGKARFTSLLSLFGLEERLISNVNQLKFIDINSNVDFESINNKLEIYRNDSIDFIKNTLGLE